MSCLDDILHGESDDDSSEDVLTSGKHLPEFACVDETDAVAMPSRGQAAQEEGDDDEEGEEDGAISEEDGAGAGAGAGATAGAGAGAGAGAAPRADPPCCDEHADDGSTQRAVVDDICRQLAESNTDLIKRIVEKVGEAACQKVLARTLDEERRGGMLTKDGKRRRSPGGVFLQLLEQGDWVDKAALKTIFAANSKFKKKALLAARTRKAASRDPHAQRYPNNRHNTKRVRR